MGEANIMLRYKFEDSFKTFKSKDICKNCIHIKACYKPNNDFCLRHQVSYESSDITSNNAEWYLFQIVRDIYITKNNVNFSFDIKKYNEYKFTYVEQKIFVIVLNIYLKFIYNWEKDILIERKKLLQNVYDIKQEIKNSTTKKVLKKEKEINTMLHKLSHINEHIITFVNSIINTRIYIKDRKVYMYVDNYDLFDIIKDVIK